MRIKKLLSPYILIPLILLFGVVSLFGAWHIIPKTELSVAVLDKTVPATMADNASYSGDTDNDYRKHIGLYWLLHHKRVVNPETGDYYDYKTDYYGNLLDLSGEIKSTELYEMKSAPDLLYVSDSYGIENNQNSGISKNDMNAISYAHSAGSVVIGEQDIIENNTDDEVASQLKELFGVEMTGWVGRYIYDLQDFTDVPEWAPPMYNEKYGEKWSFSGPGILLVGNGDIIVLEEKSCFNSKNMLKISVAKDYRKEFGKRSVNFYNWFELITPSYGTETLAEYTFNLNSDGMKQFSKISDQNVFCAVARNTSDAAPTYYFAGDFNDFVTGVPLGSFCFADSFYRFISFDRDGDVQNFYWKFYEPLMKKIIKGVAAAPLHKQEKRQTTEVARLGDKGMQISSGDSWQDFEIKGFNINGALPGSDSAARDYRAYKELLSVALDTGANTVRAYDLMPPEFYRALYDVNRTADGGRLYLIQSIAPPSELNGKTALNEIDKYKQKIKRTVGAVHGGASVETADELQVYIQDVSEYLIAFELTPNMSASQAAQLAAKNPRYKYSGTYFSADAPTEAYLAQLCDITMQISAEEYGVKVPIGAAADANALPDAVWNESGAGYNPGNIKTSGGAERYFFTAVTLMPDDNAVVNYANKFSFADERGSYPFGGYVSQTVGKIGGNVLVDGVGISTAANTYEKNSSVYGLSEKQQGEALVRMLKAVGDSGAIGGLVSDLNDSWSGLSDSERSFIVPSADNCIWFNAADKEQTKGVVSIEPKAPQEAGMELNGNGRVNQIQISHNEGYLYVTAMLDEDIDYDSEQLFIGFDTVQRNDGEYFYSKNYFANSLSGMEFIVEFESKVSASLYVTSSYNRAKGQYKTAESYTGNYDLVSVLNYGSFNESNTQFYQTGTTIRVRIPWSMLNFTDPSSKLVINDSAKGAVNGSIKTTSTDGVLVSLLIASKNDKDTSYIFPESKKTPGYKLYKWNAWEKTQYDIREKQSCSALKKYFNS